MADTVHVVNCVDSVKDFEALAKIIGDKEGMEITLKSLIKRSKENKEQTGLNRLGGQANGIIFNRSRSNAV